MKIKEGTLCYVSMSGNGGIIQPIFGETGKSFFSADQEVKVRDINCEDRNLIAVLTKANIIENLIAEEDVETIVWISKDNLKQVVK